MKILVTGGCGFIGSSFIRYLLSQYNYQVVNIDLLTYAGNLENLSEIDNHPNYQFVHADIVDNQIIEPWVRWAEGIVHFAAQTHVDRSILDPSPFIRTNIIGTFNILEAMRKQPDTTKRMVHVSTDEVYGSIEQGKADESSPLRPNSPYSASKSAADLLVRSYYKTYGLGVLTTRASNNFGPYQYPEKLIPLAITNLLEGKKVPIYGEGSQQRDWIYVEDHCAAIDLVLHQGEPGEIYNIGSGQTRTNLEVVTKILRWMEKPSFWVESVQDRPAHDIRYSVDNEKVKKLGWQSKVDFEDSLVRTIDWYKNHQTWWKRLKEKNTLLFQPLAEKGT